MCFEIFRSHTILHDSKWLPFDKWTSRMGRWKAQWMSCSTHASVKKTRTVVMHCSWIKLSWRAINSDRRIFFSPDTDDSWVDNPWKTALSVASLSILSIKHALGGPSISACALIILDPSALCLMLVLGYALGKFPYVLKEKPVVHSCSCQSPLLYASVKVKKDEENHPRRPETQSNRFKRKFKAINQDIICFTFTHIDCDQEHSAEAEQNQFKVISSFSFILASLFATPLPRNLFHNS